MVVAQRQRGNPLGWLFLLTGIILLISNDAAVARRASLTSPGQPMAVPNRCPIP